MSCIQKSNKITEKEKYYNLLVFRIDKKNIKNSKPCLNCLKYINKSKLKIKNIYYSNSDGGINKESFEHLLKNTDWISSGSRYRNCMKK